MLEPQPISTAPRDGTVILTNDGIAVWEDSPYYDIKPCFVLCTPNGDVYEDVDYGPWPLRPEHWIPLPDWIK